MARTADTSFLYAAFDDQDPRFEASREELARPEPLNVPLVVLAELLALVERRRDRKVARQVHQALQELPTFRVAPVRDERNALAIWRRHNLLSVVDAAAVQSCLESDDALLSYDRRQSKALAELRNRGKSASG